MAFFLMWNFSIKVAQEKEKEKKKLKYSAADGWLFF
jgi:hypothetical protein